MKIKTNNLLLRLITFPVKLLFSLLWFNLFAVQTSIQWLKNGGQELYHGNDHGAGIERLIEQNKQIINLLNKQHEKI